MLKGNIRVLLASRGGVVGRVSFNPAKVGVEGESPVSTFKFDGVVSATTKGATRINTLTVLVHTLEQLSVMKPDMEKEPVVIFATGVVADVIESGTFKYWVRLGSTSKGDKLLPEEIELWDKFSKLYSSMYGDVIIKNISKAKLYKNSKYTITQQQQIDAKLCEMAWDLVPKTPALGDAVSSAEL